MAALARLIRSIIGKTFAEEGEQGALHEQMEGFRKVLLHDLTAEQFGDMYAQTICYGLFAARCNSIGTRFTRTHAAHDLPRTNPSCANFSPISLDPIWMSVLCGRWIALQSCSTAPTFPPFLKISDVARGRKTR
jgi:hypothetical protein